jgi:hypothetical protein
MVYPYADISLATGDLSTMSDSPPVPPVHMSRVNAHWTQWCVWFIINIVLVSLSLLIAGFVTSSLIRLTTTTVLAFYSVLSLLMSALIGIGQYSFLRRAIPNGVTWMAISMLACLGGVILVVSVLHNWAIGAVAIGALVSLGQWWVLRWTTRQAGWWIIVSMIPWILVIAFSVAGCNPSSSPLMCAP